MKVIKLFVLTSMLVCLLGNVYAQTPTATIVGTNYNIDGSLNSTPMWVTNTLLPLVTVIDGTAVGGGIKVPCPNGAYSFAVIPGQYIAYDAPWTWRFNVPTNSGPFRMIDLINGGITNYFYTNGVTSIDSMTGPILIVGTAVSTNLSTQTLTITGGGGAGGGTVISGTNITVVTNVVGTNISYTVNISNPFQVPSLTSVPIYDAPVVSATNETIFGWEQIDGNQTNAGTLTLGGGQRIDGGVLERFEVERGVLHGLRRRNELRPRLCGSVGLRRFRQCE